MANKNFRVRNGLEVDGDASITGDLTVTGNDIKSAGGTTALTFNGARVTVADDLTITGNTINLAQGTDIFYSENNSRLNRPQVQSTSGNSSGFRVIAPNTTTSAQSSLTVFSSSDTANGEFLSTQASGSTTDPFSVRIGKYTSNVLGASGKPINFTDNNVTFASINPLGPVNGTDLTTKTYVDAHPGTTYDIDATSTTGGANLNLNGSDSTTDTVKFSGTGGTTVTQTSANEITINSTAGTTYDIDATSATGGANLNLNGSDLSVDTVKFSGGTNITVTATSATEITIDGTDLNTTYTIDASSATGGANFNLVGSDSTTDTIKFSGSGATTVAQTSANEITISSTDNNTTYDFNATSTTGGANLNLVGSDTTTDTVKLSDGTGVTVSYVSGTEVSVAIGQAVGTGDSPTFAGLTAGNVTVGLTDNNTITTTTGDLTVNAAGGDVNFDANVIAKGQLNTYDNFVILNYDTVATPTDNGGIEIERGTDPNVRVRWLESADRWGFTNDGTNYYNFAEQALDTTSTPTFAGVTAGNISVGVATDNTIASTDTNGNITLAPNGTGQVLVTTVLDTDLADDTRVLGLIEAHTDPTYTFPAQVLSTITSGSGVTSASSVAGTDGYAAGSVLTHYFADTRAGSNTAPAFTFQGANGNSMPSHIIPWTGVAGTAPSAQSTGGIMGTLNFSTYATTDFASYISGQNQGGGFNVAHPLQVQAYINETPADGTLTISGATITAVSRVSVNFANVQVTGTRGQISFNATTPAVGNAVAVTGTLTGTATGIAAGTYYIIATNGSTTAQLSATPGGYPITTTAGTTTGLTFTRQFITVTYSTQANIPFGLNAKVTISGFNNVTAGTYMAMGTSTITSINIGAPSSGVPTLSGSQSLSCPTVTAAGAGFRVRGVPSATPLNSGNRLNFIDHNAGSATYRSDAFTWAGGAYGGTGATMATLDVSGNLAITGDLRVNGNDIRSSDNTVQITTSAAGATLALKGDTITLEAAGGTDYVVIDTNKALFSKPVRTSITTGTVAQGGTYTPAATAQNSITLEITAGTNTVTSIDVNNLTVAGENGMYDILVYNNTGSSLNANDLQIINGVGNIVLQHNSSIANGARAVFEVNCIDIYAAASFMAIAV